MKKYALIVSLLAVLSVVIFPSQSSAHTVAEIVFGSCQIHGAYPDPNCTPGAAFNVTASDICMLGYARSVRNVSISTKNQVYSNYGIARHTPGQYEIDHFIPLELGGSNAISNLWPEAASPIPGFHEKDQVENYLHEQVCSGNMSLRDAQHAIVNDWVAIYDSL